MFASMPVVTEIQIVSIIRYLNELRCWCWKKKRKKVQKFHEAQHEQISAFIY